MPDASDTPLDVIIPVISKDLDILPYCLEGIKINVANSIKNIYLVGPNEKSIKEFADKYNLIFVEENSVLGFGPKDLNYVTKNGTNRSGWLFQQLLKLSGNIGDCENFITIDADHILLKPHVFITSDGKYVFYRSQEFHWQYVLSNFKLLGRFRIPLLSYVAHKMVFNKSELLKLKKHIEKRSGLPWTEAIINTIDRVDISSFSEFELYANFVNHKNVINKLWFQQVLKRNRNINLTKLYTNYPDKLSVTFPEFLNKQ